MTTLPTPPPCPECAHPTKPFTVDGEDIWHCPDPECRRRTSGTCSSPTTSRISATSAAIAARRTTRNPMATWGDFWRTFGWLAGGIWVGATVALLIAKYSVGQALVG